MAPLRLAWPVRWMPERSVRRRICEKPAAGQRLERWTRRRQDRAALPGPVTRPAYQLPAARNWSTTLCGMRPRGGTLIFFAFAQARTHWELQSTEAAGFLEVTSARFCRPPALRAACT